jgi:FlaA1/EpsC-like NDP-sugar epimerase
MNKNFKFFIVQLFRKYSLPRWFVLLFDIIIVFITFIIAYLLRYNLIPESFDLTLALKQSLIVLSVYTIFMLLFKSYSGMIRYTTIKDTSKIFGTNISALFILFLITLLSRHNNWITAYNIPFSILLIHSCAVTVLLFFFRVFINMFYEFGSSNSTGRKNVLIYDSGEIGIMVKRVIEGDPKSDYRLMGFIDEDIKLQGKKVDGYPVFSRKVLTKDFISDHAIKVFIIATDNISLSKKKEVVESMIQLGCEIYDTPSFDTWLNGHLQVKNLKKVNLEDLLDRDPISLDLGRIEQGLNGKTILVTGAAGSIGAEMVRQLTKFHSKQLVLIDQAETPSFFLDDELKNKYPSCNYTLIIGDVTNEKKMDLIFDRYKPEIIFHAAAYKHVPIMEANPHEALRTNVGGTKIITELAIKYNAEKFVMISSDKAVNPTSVMGATKKVCELLVQAQARRSNAKTKFVITRFGNVLGSNGSVIPLFKKKISEGDPVTITDPEITRFFMTIPEACQLVLEAGFMGNGGEIFIFDMGNPIKILDLAIKLIHLSGLEPYEDIGIKFTGLRPGEKLFEELFSDNEQQLPTHNPKINIARGAELDFEQILPKINDALINMYKKSAPEVIESMREIVPGYLDTFAANQ